LQEKDQELLKCFRTWDDEALGSSEPFKAAGKGMLKHVGCMINSCRLLMKKIGRSVSRELVAHSAARLPELASRLKAFQKLCQLVLSPSASNDELLSAVGAAEGHSITLSPTVAAIAWDCKVSAKIMFCEFEAAAEMLVVDCEQVEKVTAAGVTAEGLAARRRRIHPAMHRTMTHVTFMRHPRNHAIVDRAVAIVEKLVIRQLVKAKPQSLGAPCQLISDFAHAAITVSERQDPGKFLAESLVPDLAMLAALAACNAAKATVLQKAVATLGGIFASGAALSPVQARLKSQEPGRLIAARARGVVKLKEHECRTEAASEAIAEGAARIAQMIIAGSVSLEGLDSERKRVLGLVDDLEKESSFSMHQLPP